MGRVGDGESGGREIGQLPTALPFFSRPPKLEPVLTSVKIRSLTINNGQCSGAERLLRTP